VNIEQVYIQIPRVGRVRNFQWQHW